MNLLITERTILSKLSNHLKSHSFCQINGRFIYSKICVQTNVIQSNPFLSTRKPILILKRDLNYAKIRRIWRIIRLKDRGIEHNFLKDGIDPKSNIIVYKAEMNRLTTLGGIVFPLLNIVCCVALLIYNAMNVETSVDPFDRPHILEKYFKEVLIIVSLFQISLSKRYVLRIYYNKSKNAFTVSTWRWYLPLKTHTIECKPGSAVECPWVINAKMMDFMLGNTKIANKRYFITEENFTFPIYYNILFGFTPSEALKEYDLDLTDNHNKIADQVIKQRDKDFQNSSNF